MSKSLRGDAGGFSLVEVALALGVASFCLITLLALIPVGISHYQQSDTQGIMASLATMVARDLQSTSSGGGSVNSPRFAFPVPAAGGTSGTLYSIYVDASGMPTGTGVNVSPTASSIYRISVQFYPPSSSSAKAATPARVMVTFPALADSAPAAPAKNYSSVFETTLTLNRN